MTLLIGIAALLVVIILVVWYMKSREKYGNYSDLTWAGGFPGNCKTCNSSYNPDLADPNLMRRTLETSLTPMAVDYYGLPQGQTYFGDDLPEKLPGKIWRL